MGKLYLGTREITPAILDKMETYTTFTLSGSDNADIQSLISSIKVYLTGIKDGNKEYVIIYLLDSNNDIITENNSNNTIYFNYKDSGYSNNVITIKISTFSNNSTQDTILNISRNA